MAMVVISAARFACGADFTPSAAPTESLTVRECVDRARKHAPEPLIAAAEQDAAALDSTATLRSRRAALSLQGGANVAPTHFYDPALTNLGDYALKLKIEVPLLDGGARHRALQRSALISDESRVTLEQTARDAGLRAGALAIAWLQLTETEQFQSQSIEWLEHLAIVMEAGVRSGMRGRADAERATLERDAATAELELTRRESASVARALGRELGGGNDFIPAVREEDDVRLAPPASADSLALVSALRSAPEVRLAQLGAAERRLAHDEAKRRSAWQVDVAADAGLAGSDLTRVVPPDVRSTNPNATLSDRLRRDLGASLSLQFRRPLFDRSVGDAVAARSAAIRAQELRWSSELDAQNRLSLEILARWHSAATRYGVARDVAARAGEHLLRVESLHAAGSATLLELLDARRALDDAHGRLLDARAATLGARLEAEARL